MARKMSKAPTHAYRAVVVWEHEDSGEQRTEYLGPYWRKSDAKGRISNLARPNFSRWRFVSGELQAAPLGAWQSTP
jgi:hypothetical protein